MILELGISALGNAGFESQRTVMATGTRDVSRQSRCAVFTTVTFRLTIRAQKWGIAEYAVIFALHAA